MWEGASWWVGEDVARGEGEDVTGGTGGARENVVGGMREDVIGGAGGAREVGWGWMREVYSRCDWGISIIKNMCVVCYCYCLCILIFVLYFGYFYDAKIEIHGCTQQHNSISVGHTWESSW